jgi:hypothetical protein
LRRNVADATSSSGSRGTARRGVCGLVAVM